MQEACPACTESTCRPVRRRWPLTFGDFVAESKVEGSNNLEKKSFLCIFIVISYYEKKKQVNLMTNRTICFFGSVPRISA